MPTKTTTKSKPKSSRIAMLEEQLALARHQEKLNAQFAKMDPADKRVAVAKDVIKQLDMKRIFAKSRVYVERVDGQNEFAPNTPVVDAITAAPCHVCAKGAVFVSMVEITNGVTFGDVLDEDYGSPELTSISSSEIVNYVGDVFPEKMLNLMEAIFEKYDIGSYLQTYLGPRYTKLSVPWDRELFVQRGEDAEGRLRWVMENIVANKGDLRIAKRDIEVV